MARVAHLGRPQADRRHVLHTGARHDAARLQRCDHDSRAAGARSRRCTRLSAARTFQSDFLGARHDYDLVHGNAVRGRAHELRSTAATRCSRCGIPDAQFRQLLADRLGRVVGQHFAGGRRVLESRLVGVSATERIAILARCRRRLLSLVSADIGYRYPAGGNKFRHDHPQIAGTGDGLYAHAGLLLDRACRQPAHCRGFSGPDRDARDAGAGSLSRLSLLHARRPGQSDAVLQPVLGMGGTPKSTS
ncbi:hypothetical protein ACVW0J_007242 [Bradyrhizobium sp. i1.7.7]